MEHQVKTPYGTVTFKNECPPERVQEVLARYASNINFGERKGGDRDGKNAA